MPLQPPAAVETVFAPLAGRKVAYVQGLCGNVGDGLIELAAFQLLSHFGATASVVNPNPQWAGELTESFDELLLFGGGNMGYPCSKAIRRAARNCSLPKTLLPQSWVTQEDAPYERVFVRERRSQPYCPHARLVPDLALCLDYPLPVPAPVQELGLCLRRDNERQFSGPAEDPAHQLTRQDPLAYLSRAARFATIITDRLHFAICGLICRRRVILLPNNYHKNLGMFETWLRDLGCEWADHPLEAQARWQTSKQSS